MQANEAAKTRNTEIHKKLEEANNQNKKIQEELDQKNQVKEELASHLKVIKERYAHLEKLEASIPKVSTTTKISSEIEKQGPPSQSETQVLPKSISIN